MKTPAIAHEKRHPAAADAKAAPSRSKRLSRRIVAEFPPRKAQAIAKPIRLLPERFPKPNKERICLGLYAPDAQEVFVAGSFNGWQSSAIPLQKQPDGQWGVELMLEPGRYEYRFVVDGRWLDDPLASAYVSNPFGSLNCVLVADRQVSLIGIF